MNRRSRSRAAINWPTNASAWSRVNASWLDSIITSERRSDSNSSSVRYRPSTPAVYPNTHSTRQTTRTKWRSVGWHADGQVRRRATRLRSANSLSAVDVRAQDTDGASAVMRWERGDLFLPSDDAGPDTQQAFEQVGPPEALGRLHGALTTSCRTPTSVTRRPRYPHRLKLAIGSNHVCRKKL